MRSNKCKNCKVYLGKSHKEFPEGTIDDGTNYWCSNKCYKGEKMKKKFRYMHLLDRKPSFYDGYQVVYASQYVEELCDSLNKIREEQKLSLSHRRRDGLQDSKKEYGYIKVVIE